MTQATATRSTIELPQNNPTERLGELMPAEGENGVFAESWYPVCLSSELKKGELRSETFLDGKIIVFRGEDGVARAMSAYCPHLGADLGVGAVVGNNVQCAFHRWEFDGDGVCAKTGIGDPAPKRARLFKFPTQEVYGVVWVFNGEKPHWEIPSFEVPDDKIVYRTYRFPDYFNCDPWVFAANTPDMQHFKVVHKTEFATEDPHAGVDWDDWGFRYKVIAAHQQGIPIEWTVGIRGTTLFWQEGPYGDFWLGGMVGFGLPVVGKHEAFAILALEDVGDSKLIDERFDIVEALMHRTVGEDKDILNTIHYRPGALTKGDTTLSRYLDFLRSYPRSHISGPFIK
ncbi:aromatic ring-hydroxylating dioxygenase subunit alpha [Parasphingopyxis sp.]|uniref:aromatic ring-hydroxylating oxygenase subunit alpha n=1 Tax=Parasphingopyxis sp. TaxID=1920299 RepID=UPI00262EA827|nr:aromatic ring-hydroxylating dioxygenase subunit alpha [Parasphingopyxis sp.]